MDSQIETLSLLYLSKFAIARGLPIWTVFPRFELAKELADLEQHPLTQIVMGHLERTGQDVPVSNSWRIVKGKENHGGITQTHQLILKAGGFFTARINDLNFPHRIEDVTKHSARLHSRVSTSNDYLLAKTSPEQILALIRLTVIEILKTENSVGTDTKSPVAEQEEHAI